MSESQPSTFPGLKAYWATVLLIFLMAATTPLFSQKLEHRPGDYLVQVKEGYNVEEIAKRNAVFRNQTTDLKVDRKLSPHLNIYLMTFNYGDIHERDFLEYLRRDEGIINIQLNHRLELRQDHIPNDPLFEDQWYLHNTGQNGGIPGADISALDAWELTTGGVTAHGDTIVVAVIDDGININHPDLVNHIWVNRHELEGTGEDDDGNGYIDDVYGWNTFSNTGNIEGGFHGTPVSGMIGAMTNNDLGVAGLNWNVKIMTIVGGNGFESNAIESYTYALVQRQIYNETNGERGAFVVATNSSWGRDGLRPEDAPLWCAFYDLMGEHGILNVGATTNRNNNVDVVSDMPTACNSPFLISVTSTNIFDSRANTGFGKTTIDLAAPGAGILTMRDNGGYTTQSGTSFAAPLVAGTIALAYSIDCTGFMNIVKSDPQRGATMIKEAIIEGVDPIESLREETKNGGRLNAYNTVNDLTETCMDCPPPGSFERDTLTPFSVTFSWTDVIGTEQTNVRVRRDSGAWEVLEDVSSPLEIDLELCTKYDFEIQALCTDGESPWVELDSFLSIGCCEAPSQFEIQFDSASATIFWNDIIPAFEYTVRFREFGQEFWEIKDLWIPDSITFFNLLPCHIYEFQVQSRCDTGFTSFSEILIIETPNCFDCTEPDFCEPMDIDADFDWIDSAQIGDVTLNTGPGDGYVDMTGEGLAGILNLGETMELRLVPGHVGGPWPEYFRIWIDFNRDGIFSSDSINGYSELVFDAGRSVSEAIDTVLSLPDDPMIQSGHATMRIQMKYMENPDSIPPADPCESFEFGQVYDFCVFLYRPDIVCPEVREVVAEEKTPESFTATWEKLDFGLAYNLRYRPLGSDEWEDEVAVPDTFYTIDGLSPCSPYEVQVRSICPFDTSDYSMSHILFTECPNTVVETDPDPGFNVTAYPNPFESDVQLRIETEGHTGGRFEIRIWDVTGRLTGTQQIDLGSNQTSNVSLHQMRAQPPGLYFIELYDGRHRSVTRVVKQ